MDAVPSEATPLRVRLDVALEPARALAAISELPHAFALTGAWAGGGAILGCRPRLVIESGAEALRALDRLPRLAAEPPPGLVGGGWFGWLGYGLGSLIERLPPGPPRPWPLPRARLAYYDHVLRRDPEGRWWFEALVAPGAKREAEAARDLLEGRLAAAPPPAPGPPPRPFRPLPPGPAGHLAAVRRCVERIRAGDLFQANLALRLVSEWRGELSDLHARLAATLAPPYAGTFLHPAGGVVSVSPELFLRRRGREVATAPIKGTIVRPPEAGAAEAALAELRASAKDAAEHTMIVDVARNDLGRVCEPGSIDAPRLPRAEQHPGLWHLVSTVRGTLRPGVADSELVRASFPPCSVTGAPKIAAMEAIASLEAVGRDVYTGAIGYSSPAAGLELNVAIRTFEAREGRLWLATGGGIVADSEPERELDEALAKARPLIEAASSQLELEPPRPTRSPRRGEASPRRSPHREPPPALRRGLARPDPGRGLIETLAVRAGRPVRLERHLERLRESLALLYGSSPPADLEERLRERAAGGPAGLRVRAEPDGRCVIEPLGPRERSLPVRLAPFVLPGGLGAHKWADRQLVDHLGSGEVTPLLVDEDGDVLEAGWGNVWIVEGSRLVTPPADGRLLAGVTRAALLAGELDAPDGRRPAEERLTLERLERAEAIFVSSALAGPVPATLAAY